MLSLLLLSQASVVSDSVRPHRWQPTRLPCPWDSPGKISGVDCHFLLQCIQVKSESEVAQSCPTLSDPLDCSLPGSSVHGIFQARVLEWGAIVFSRRSVILSYKMGTKKENKEIIYLLFPSVFISNIYFMLTACHHDMSYITWFPLYESPS